MTEPARTRSDQQPAGGLAFARGGYTGAINPAFHTPSLPDTLITIKQLLASSQASLLAGGRNQTIQLGLDTGQHSLPVVVKSFGRQTVGKDWFDLHYRKSRAQRSFEAALLLQANRVVTPAPVAFLQQWQGSRLMASYYLSVFAAQAVSLQQALLELLHHHGNASEFIALLQPVARECRKMHDAGFLHRDLGNQNVLLRQAAPRRWTPAGIIDLNRGLIRQPLNPTQRGQDLARLRIPSNLMLMFLDMYHGSPAPDQLIKSWRRHRARFERHQRTRKWRHPVREARIRRASRALPVSALFPRPHDIWIWDDSSDQALAALERAERIRQYPAGRLRRMVLDTLTVLPRVWHEYRRVKAGMFKHRVVMAQRLGLAVAPDGASLPGELELLSTLGPIPLLLRFSHHQTPEQQSWQKSLVKQLRSAGHRITAAFVQDRQAVRKPASWQAFVLDTLEEIGDQLEAIEFGHAINRVKWGIWSFAELRGLYGCLEQIARRWPQLAILGPATIDFEYPFLVSALRLWPRAVAISALSHHLYVDRRGAPEHPQNGCGALEKFALAKAVARAAGRGLDRVVVSEVNWPLAGTAAHSPVTPPFTHADGSAGHGHDSGVDEATYACYLVRYLALALCSSLVERVYWWRLVARGYGLADRNRQGKLRARPGFFAFRHFITVLGEATVQTAEWPRRHRHNHGEYRIGFVRADGEHLVLCWRHGPATAFPSELTGARFEDCYGNVLPARPEQLQGAPIYVRGCKRSRIETSNRQPVPVGETPHRNQQAEGQGHQRQNPAKILAPGLQD